MTIKKLGLSAIAASMLATSAYAAATVETNATVTFNSHYTNAGMTGDENASLTVDYNMTGVGVASGNYIVLTVAGDMDFPGVSDDDDAGDWTLLGVTPTAATTFATGAQFQTSGTQLLMTVASTIPSDANMTLQYNGSSTGVAFFVNAGIDTNATLNIKAQDSNFINIANTSATLQVAGVQDNSNAHGTGTMTCAQTVTIDSSTRNDFDETTNETNSTSYTCDANISAVASESDIDYDYANSDLAFTFAGAVFADGNYTSTVGGSTTETIASNTQTFNVLNVGTVAQNHQFRYELSGTETLSPLSVAGTFTSTVSGVTTSLETTADAATTWALNTFSGTVKYLRSNTAGTTETSIRLFNSHTADAPYTIIVTAVDGSTVGTVNSTTSVPAGGALAITATDIKALVLDQLSITLANGFDVTIGYTDVAKALGDISATQQDANGKYGIRVNTNNNVTTSSVYQGL